MKEVITKDEMFWCSNTFFQHVPLEMYEGQIGEYSCRRRGFGSHSWIPLLMACFLLLLLFFFYCFVLLISSCSGTNSYSPGIYYFPLKTFFFYLLCFPDLGHPTSQKTARNQSKLCLQCCTLTYIVLEFHGYGTETLISYRKQSCHAWSTILGR